MHTNDAMELRITWEEAQELLRPSPTAEPTVVMVEDHEFEEFEVSFAWPSFVFSWKFCSHSSPFFSFTSVNSTVRILL